MTGLAQALGAGVIVGIILFFILAYFGWIDKLIRWIDKR
jgi:hypothetical protein